MKYYFKILIIKLFDWKIIDLLCSCKVGKISRKIRRFSISLFLCLIFFSVLYVYILIVIYIFNEKLCKMKWMKKLNLLILIVLYSWFLKLRVLICRVELNKFYVFVREFSFGYYGSVVFCIGVGWGVWEIGSFIFIIR